MEREQLANSIQQLIPRLSFFLRYSGQIIHIHRNDTIAERQVPRHCTSLSGSEVLHGMKRERGEVGYFASHFPMPFGTERVGTVCTDDDSSDVSLQSVVWMKEMLLCLNYFKHTVVVGHDTGYIYRHDYLCMFSNSLREFVVIHLDTVLLTVNHNQLAAYMLRYRRCSCVSICRNYHLVIWLKVEQMQDHFHRSCGRIKTHRLIGMQVF